MAVPDHIRTLRARIGHDFLLVPSVTATIFDDEGRVLVVRIAGRDDEFWTLPGGLLEPDERPIDAVVREVCEETGLDATVIGLVGMHGGPEFRHTHANGDETGYVMGTYLCEATGTPRVRDVDEIAETRWVTIEEAGALPSGRWFPTVIADAFDAKARARVSRVDAP